MKRFLPIIAVLVVVAFFGSFHGQRIIGFSYAVSVNNLATECPNTVVGVEGSRLTLDDGRVLMVRGFQANEISEELKQCENRVRFDPATKTLCTMRYVSRCGFDWPQRSQLITIRIRRIDLRQYTSHEFAEAREVEVGR